MNHWTVFHALFNAFIITYLIGNSQLTICVIIYAYEKDSARNSSVCYCVLWKEKNIYQKILVKTTHWHPRKFISFQRYFNMDSKLYINIPYSYKAIIIYNDNRYKKYMILQVDLVTKKVPGIIIAHIFPGDAENTIINHSLPMDDVRILIAEPLCFEPLTFVYWLPNLYVSNL